jgi:RNA polymerase sporulation-specific sigma factor
MDREEGNEDEEKEKEKLELRKKYEKQNKELIEYVNRVKMYNDEDSFNVIHSKLANHIKSVVSKFFISGFTNDDIHQECLIALRFKAIDDYDETKGPFIKFARLCIRRHIITELKACKKKKNLALNSALSLDEVYGDDDGESSYHLIDTIADDKKKSHFDNLSAKERGKFLYNHLARRLTKLEYKILVYYIKGYNYTEIVNLVKDEDPHLFKSDEIENRKKVIDNGLCRIKSKAKELKDEIDISGNKIQGDMFAAFF